LPRTHIQDHVDLIAKHELDFLANRTRAERIIDAVAGYIGSLTFVVVHIIFFALWIVWNVLPHTRHFDTRPFSLLQTLVAMESILAASFILMRQGRLGRRADERDHLMLQILILSEKEITALLGVNREIANEVGVSDMANEDEVRALSEPTSIDDVAQTIAEKLPGNG
jgi:uncharacterized membrane protein